MASRMLHRLIGSSVDDAPCTPSSEQKPGVAVPPPNACRPDMDTCSTCNKSSGAPGLSFKGGQLFELFVFDQVNKSKVTSRGLKDFFTQPADCTRDACETAARLCDLAVTFSQSEDRQKVKDAAMTVSNHMMRQELTTALQAMLSESPSLDEGILVLFFFCLDLSARLLETEHREVWEVLTYCKTALDLALNPYVSAHGGWAAVGSSAVQAVTTGLSLLDTVRKLGRVGSHDDDHCDGGGDDDDGDDDDDVKGVNAVIILLIWIRMGIFWLYRR
ncbi:apoptosis regulator BAX [Elysia marginata]|uniref:Apoptosis regulator BAX n=1 Tax=Elysia marginata TaxID=1093978 RepID=A0AAV4JD06_9GAST|nr:apoptosis regulator BAX [Elysia marginata]